MLFCYLSYKKDNKIFVVKTMRCLFLLNLTFQVINKTNTEISEENKEK